MAIWNWLFKKKATETQSPTTDPVISAIAIMSDYGRALEMKSASGYTYCDASNLPYPKDIIKNALITVLRGVEDPQFREQVKTGIILLSDWQDGVEGGVRNPLLNYDKSTGIPQDLEAMSKYAQEVVKWGKIAMSESERVKDELIAEGLW